MLIRGVKKNCVCSGKPSKVKPPAKYACNFLPVNAGQFACEYGGVNVEDVRNRIAWLGVWPKPNPPPPPPRLCTHLIRRLATWPELC